MAIIVACAGSSMLVRPAVARAQFGLITLPLNDPAYVQLAALERGVTHDTDFEVWAGTVWSLNAGLGSEVSLASFRKDVIIEVYNEAGQLVLCRPTSTHAVSRVEPVPSEKRRSGSSNTSTSPPGSLPSWWRQSWKGRWASSMRT